MRKIFLSAFLLLCLLLTACSDNAAITAEPVSPTPKPTAKPTLEPDPVWGPTTSPTVPPTIPAGVLALGDAMEIDAPYPVSLNSDGLDIGVGDQVMHMQVYSCRDEAYPPLTNFVFASIVAPDPLFEDPQIVNSTFSEITQQFIGEVSDAEVSEFTMEGPEGAVSALRIVTKVNSAPVDLRLIPYKNSLVMVYGTAINGEEIEAVQGVLDSLRFRSS